MAQERVEFQIAANTVGMENISKLINAVGEVQNEQKRLNAALSQAKSVGDKLAKSTGNVASATRDQARAVNDLRNRLDPMFAAQKRFNQQMDEADRLYDAGLISLKEYTAAQKQARDALRQHAQAVQAGNAGNRNNINDLDAQSKALRRQRQGLQQVGMQVNDFATSVSTGASITTAFNQQIGQLGYALSIMGDAQGEATTKFQKFGRFLAGPWGAALTIASMVIGQMAEGMFEAEEATVDIEKAMDLAKLSIEELTEVTKLLSEANEDYQKEARDSLTQTLSLTRGHYESAKARLADAEAALKQRMANRITIGTDPAAIASLSNTSAAFAQLQSGVESANSALEAAEEQFLGASAEMMQYNATTDSTTRALDALGESMDLVRAMVADGSLTQAEGRQQMNALAQAQKNLEETTRKSGRATKEIKSEMDKFLESLVRTDNRLELARQAFLAGSISASQYRTEIEKAEKAERQFAKVPVDKIKALRGADKPLELFQGPFDVSPLEQFNREQKKIREEAANIQSSYEAIGNAVANGFKGMITGAESFGNAMKNIIQSVIDELFRLFVVQQIVGFVKGALGGIFGGGGTSSGTGSGFISGGFATGGYPQMNKPAIVGERGPELFVPTSSGKIIPNHQLGGGSGMVINVDARGSSDPEAVRQQVQQGILEAAPSIVAAAQNRTINTLRRPRLAGTL